MCSSHLVAVVCHHVFVQYHVTKFLLLGILCDGQNEKKCQSKKPGIIDSNCKVQEKAESDILLW